jgi:hypothetical protein
MSKAYIVYRSDYHASIIGFDHIFTSLETAIDFATDKVYELTDHKYTKEWIKKQYRESFKDTWDNKYDNHKVDYTDYRDMDADMFIAISEVPFD